MKNKILLCATVDLHFKAFHLQYMKWLQEQGWEVHVAAKGNMDLQYCDKKYELPIERSPLSVSNLKAYKVLRCILDSNKYNIVHCHTPMGGVLTRLAARESRKKGTKVLYTAHGFHFYRGTALINWIIYYPLEKWLAHYTDCLITINKEDYELATRHSFKAGSIERIHGVGIDTEMYKPVNMNEKDALRVKKGYSIDKFILFYAAELNRNKNQGVLIEAVAEVKKSLPQVKLLLAGFGTMDTVYKNMALELGVSEEVEFLGYRSDIADLLKMSDVVVAGSFREGLPVNIMEAMACGKPVIASDNRGHRELIDNNVTGFIIQGFNNWQKFAEKIYELYDSKELQEQFSTNSRYKIHNYAATNVIAEINGIFNRII